MKSLLKQIVSGAMLLALPLMLTGCEDILGKWERPTPVVPSTTKTPGTISYATTTMLKGSLDPTFSNTLTQVGDGSITYQSSDPSVATVDATTGKVTPVAPGTVTIKAIVSDSETYTYASKEASYTIELQDGYSYRWWNTTTKQFDTLVKPSSECELITPSTTNFDGSKRYIALGNVTVDHDINVTGGLSVITLCDNAELTINGRLYGATLHITAQSEGDEMGKLNVTTDTGTGGNGVIDLTTDLTIHGGKITAIATGNTNKLHGIRCGGMTMYGGEVKAQGNESSTDIGSHGIYRPTSGVIGIHGGKVEAIGGNSTAGTNRAGDGICGRYEIDGNAIVIATGGNAIGANKDGGYGIDANSYSSSIGGRAQVTARAGNSVKIGGCAMHLQGGVTIQGSAQVTATGGDYIGTDGKGGPGSYNGTLTLKDQASYTAKSGKSSGNADGQDAMWNNLDYYGGTFTAIGGAKGPSGANDGKAISSSRNISNQTAGTITLEYSDDGQTWGGTFDINASTSSTPTYHAIRKTN